MACPLLAFKGHLTTKVSPFALGHWALKILPFSRVVKGHLAHAGAPGPHGLRPDPADTVGAKPAGPLPSWRSQSRVFGGLELQTPKS